MSITANTLQINNVSIDATGNEYAGMIVIETDLDQIVLNADAWAEIVAYVARTHR